MTRENQARKTTNRMLAIIHRGAATNPCRSLFKALATAVFALGQPHFADQPADGQVFWGYALLPDRIGNFFAKPMEDCPGAGILLKLCGHLRLGLDRAVPAITPHDKSLRGQFDALIKAFK